MTQPKLINIKIDNDVVKDLGEATNIVTLSTELGLDVTQIFYIGLDGSRAYGLDTEKSDIDVTIIARRNDKLSYIFDPNGKVSGRKEFMVNVLDKKTNNYKLVKLEIRIIDIVELVYEGRRSEQVTMTVLQNLFHEKKNIIYVARHLEISIFKRLMGMVNNKLYIKSIVGICNSYIKDIVLKDYVEKDILKMYIRLNYYLDGLIRVLEIYNKGGNITDINFIRAETYLIALNNVDEDVFKKIEYLKMMMKGKLNVLKDKFGFEISKLKYALEVPVIIAQNVDQEYLDDIDITKEQNELKVEITTVLGISLLGTYPKM